MKKDELAEARLSTEKQYCFSLIKFRRILKDALRKVATFSVADQFFYAACDDLEPFLDESRAIQKAEDRKTIVEKMEKEFKSYCDGWMSQCRYYEPHIYPKEMPISEIKEAINYAKERTLAAIIDFCGDDDEEGDE